MGCLLGTWEVTGKESCGLEQICGCLYIPFKTNVGFTRNEKMGFSEAFRGNTNGAKHPRNATSYAGFLRNNVSGENMSRLGEAQKFPKNGQKLKVIIHAFGLSRGPSSERHEMPPRAMGGPWNGVMWIERNIWMHLCSFLGNFRFHEKWTNGVFKGFMRQHKWCQAPVQCYKSRRLS